LRMCLPSRNSVSKLRNRNLLGNVGSRVQDRDTGIKEFDYPKGNQNVYASYQGAGGIPIDSIWKRLLFAWTQKDINILLTGYLKPDSRIQIWRGVQDA